MEQNSQAHTTSQLEIDSVRQRLEDLDDVWLRTPNELDYTNFDQAHMLAKLKAVYETIKLETNAAPSEIEQAYQASVYFAEQAFGNYQAAPGQALGGKIDRAFVVPMRSDRYNEDYSSESTPFYPLLDPNRFGVDSNIRMRTTYGLPPTILDTYLQSDQPNETGALVLSPMYADMIADLRPDRHDHEQNMQLFRVAQFVLKETVELAHKRLGADVIGLGAILPKLTDFGNSLRAIDGMDNLVTTTGHGGTVHMIAETVDKISRETLVDHGGKIGIIGGAGSIGYSSLDVLRERIPELEIYTYDKNQQLLSEKISARGDADKLHQMNDSLEVLRSADVIVSAITGRIDLDAVDPDNYLDLSGKVIIDDSQPGCFDVDQVTARGGKLVWVVGEDGSQTNFVVRDGLFSGGTPYNYGDKSGLYGSRSEFACGQEAAVIAKYQAYDKAIRGPVDPESVRKVGKLCVQAGIKPAPFQAFGQPVHID